MKRRSDAFTLVELLVVVTIIVVLLTLLTPALDEAMYQAALAKCGAEQSLIAKGATTYAFDFKRTYPWRSAVHDPNTNYQPHFIKNNQAGGRAGVDPPGTGTGFVYAGHDDRPEFEGYIALDALLDPLAFKIGLDYDEVDPETWLMLPRTLFFGFRYTFSSMVKVGQSIHFNDERFNVLTADLEITFTSSRSTHSAHPDSKGILAKIYRENAPLVPGAWADSVGYWAATQSVVDGPTRRGTLDRNVGFVDNSVIRYPDLDVPPIDTPLTPGDHPMRAVPITSNPNATVDRRVTPAAPEDVSGGAVWIPPN